MPQQSAASVFGLPPVAQAFTQITDGYRPGVVHLPIALYIYNFYAFYRGEPRDPTKMYSQTRLAGMIRQDEFNTFLIVNAKCFSFPTAYVNVQWDA